MGGSSYLVGERGPEIFVPESHGHIIPNSQMAGQGAGVTNIYNLSMPTTANPGDVRMAFELMKAWA
jgi:phage-related minor tail protein